MKRREEEANQSVERHLKLFSAPPVQEIDNAKERTRRRLSIQSVGEANELPVEFGTLRSAWRWRLGLAGAAAAVVLAVILTSIVHRHRAVAVVEENGAIVAIGEIIRASADGSVLVLADGSRVEMREQSELVLEHANDGVRIRLNKGGVIVNAAKQHGHLYVQTKDVTVSVVGTVFLVSSEEEGSRVAVVQGMVHVQHGTTEQTLLPGEQVITNSKMSSLAPASLAILQQSAVLVGTPSEKFEEISIRSSPLLPSVGGITVTRPGQPCFIAPWIQIDPGRLMITQATLHGLIAAAYGASCTLPDAIAGEPQWARSEWYDIQALIPAGSPVYARSDLLESRAPKLQRMLQNLLADRFKLTLRREMREMPAYELIVEKTAKWECHLPETCHGLRLSEDQDKDSSSVDREGMTLIPTSLNLHTSIAAWTGIAALNTGRPVIDKTGLKGFYDIRLEYPDLARADAVAEQTANPAVRSNRFSTSIQEQLGFKLVSTRAVVEVIVIEHVEKPSEN